MMIAQLSLTAPLAGPVFPNTGNTECGKEKGRVCKQLPPPPLQDSHTWRGHVSYGGRTKGHSAILSFCASERSNLVILQTLPAVERAGCVERFSAGALAGGSVCKFG